MTVEFQAKHRSTPILGLDLDCGLGLKGASEQIEELSWENITETNRRWQGTNGKLVPKHG